MPRWRTLFFTSLLGTALVVLAGCGPRAGAALEAAPDDMASDALMISLPSLVLDVDASGAYTMGGIPLADLGTALGQDLALPAMDAETLAMLAKGNVQHAQLVNANNGLLILVNGEPIPSLAWDGESLSITAGILEQFGVESPLLGQILPLLGQLGIGVTLHFPVAEGVEAIPLVVEGDASMAAAAVAARDDFLDSVGGTGAQLQLHAAYDEEGNISIAGLDSETLSEIGLNLESLQQTPSNLEMFEEMGIDALRLATDADGIFITINDMTLPHISWANGELNHALNLAANMGLIGGDSDPEAVLAVVNQWLPAIQASEITFTIDFP